MGVKEASAAYADLSLVVADAVDAIRPGYKQTEVGVIPEDWSVSTVGMEFSIQLGKMLDAEKNEGVPKPFIGNRAVQWGQIDLSGIGSIKLTSSDIQRYRLLEGDLLVCEGGEVGRSAVWKAPVDECYYQKALHRLRPKRGYDVSVMLNILFMHASSGLLQNYVTQTSIAHLPKDKFELVPIPLPSTAEQEAIAGVLSDADALIESLQQLITKKRQIKQGAMQVLLTGQQRLPGFSEGWKSKRLKELGATFGGLTGKTKADFGSGRARYITFMNIMTNVVIDCTTFERVQVWPIESQNQVRKGDLFFNGSSETPEEVGMCSVLMDEATDVYLNSFCFGFRCHDLQLVNGKYLAYYFRSNQGRELLKSLAQGATRYNLSKTALLRVEFPCPSVDEQTAIAAVVSDMDAEIVALEIRLNKTREIKQGMMQALLTGSIRLL